MCAIDSASAAIIFNDGTTMKLYVTIDSGLTWIEKLSIGSLISKPNIAYDLMEDRLWLSYLISVGNATIRLRYSDNKGDNWTIVDYSTGQSIHEINDMDISPLNSKVYIVLHSDNSETLYRYIFSKTGNYESMANSGGASEFFDTCIVVDSVGNDWIITGWNSYVGGGDGSRIIYLENGVGAGTDKTLFGVANTYSELIIPGSLCCAVDGDDNIYAFYTKASDEKTYYRKYNGSTWESEVELIGIANDRISTEKRPIAGSDKLNFVYYRAP